MFRRWKNRLYKWKTWKKYTNLGKFSQILILLGIKKWPPFDYYLKTFEKEDEEWLKS